VIDVGSTERLALYAKFYTPDKIGQTIEGVNNIALKRPLANAILSAGRANSRGRDMKTLFTATLLMLLSGGALSALAQEGSWLGVQLSKWIVVNDKGDSYSGAKVDSVVADSPATVAGLKEGDLILSVDGRETKDAKQLSELLQQMPPGSLLHLRLKRNNADLELTVVLGRRSAPPTSPTNPASCRDTYEPRLGCY
jgi:predicted metalloprotease with PDZ domain